MGHEQVVRLLPGQDGATRLLQVALQPAARFFAKRHQTLLVAFAHHAQHAFVQPHLKGLERDQFRHAQAAGIHQLQHGAVAQAQGVAQVRGAEQGLHMGLRQGFGHPQGLACGLQAQRGVLGDAAFAQGPVKVPAQHRQAPVGRGGPRLRMAGGKVAAQVHFGCGVQCQRGLLLCQPLGVEREVTAVRCQGVAREAVFQPQGIYKGIDRAQAVFKHPKTIARPQYAP